MSILPDTRLEKRITLIVAILAALAIPIYVTTSPRNNETNRLALLKIRDTIEIGDPLQRVFDVYQQNKAHLKLNTTNPNEVYIETPLVFGASNWTLRIEINNSKVAAVKVRTADGPSPPNGPKDKIASDK